MGKTTVIYSLEFALCIFVSSLYCNVYMRCCYAAGAVLLGLAYAGNSILQHGSSSLTPPAMLLGCCYVTCTDAELYRLWRGVVLRTHMFYSNKFINPCAADCKAELGKKNTSPHSEAQRSIMEQGLNTHYFYHLGTILVLNWVLSQM